MMGLWLSTKMKLVWNELFVVRILIIRMESLFPVLYLLSAILLEEREDVNAPVDWVLLCKGVIFALNLQLFTQIWVCTEMSDINIPTELRGLITQDGAEIRWMLYLLLFLVLCCLWWGQLVFFFAQLMIYKSFVDFGEQWLEFVAILGQEFFHLADVRHPQVRLGLGGLALLWYMCFEPFAVEVSRLNIISFRTWLEVILGYLLFGLGIPSFYKLFALSNARIGRKRAVTCVFSLALHICFMVLSLGVCLRSGGSSEGAVYSANMIMLCLIQTAAGFWLAATTLCTDTTLRYDRELLDWYPVLCFLTYLA
jgi:hypothetical protein